MADEDLVVRASLRDELSQPIRRTRREVDETAAAVRRLDRAGNNAGTGGLSRMERHLRRNALTLSGVHTRLKSVSSYLTGAFARGLRVAALGVGALTLAVAGFGLKGASDFQQTRIAFDTLLGSVERGGALFRELQQLNLKTPFELSEIAPATQLLLRYGVAAEQVVPTLKSLLDAAALSGAPAENLQRLSLAVGQVIQKGRLSGEEARQLAEAGIDAYGLMAEKLGITTAAARDLGEQGKLSADVFLQGLIALDGPLAKLRGGAEKMSGTLMGQLSNLKDAIKVRLADAASPLVDRLTASIPRITELVGSAVDQLGPAVFDLVGLLVDGLQRTLPIVAPLLATVIGGLGDLLTAAAPAFDALDAVVGELNGAVVELVAALVPVMPDLVDAFVALVRVLPSFVRLLAALVPIVGPIADLVTSLLDMEPVRGIAAGILAALLGYRALAGIVGVLQAFAGSLFQVAAGQQAVAATGGAGVPGAAGGGLGKGAGALGTVAGLGLASTGFLGANKSGIGDEASIIGGFTLAGASLGSIVPGVGTVLGGGLGLGVGTVGVLARNLLGGGKSSSPPATSTSAYMGPAATASTSAPVPTSYSSSTTVAPGAIVVYPQSDLDLQTSITRGIETYERDRAERGA